VDILEELKVNIDGKTVVIYTQTAQYGIVLMMRMDR